MHRLVVVLALVLATFTVGCGASSSAFRSSHVRHVAASESGGVVELSGPIVPATADAHLVMTEECQGRWRRLEGSEATAMISDSTTAKTGVDGDAWRMDDDRLIAYECMGRRRASR